MSKLSDTIQALDGVTDFKMLDSTSETKVDSSRAVFKYNDLNLGFQQITSSNITMNILQTSFKFHIVKKVKKINILEVINSFNRTTPGVKASLRESSETWFSITFAMEFICPDDLIGQSIVSPSITVLFSSGSMLKNMVGRHGITLAAKQ